MGMIACIWEHNGESTLLYARDYPGVAARGANLEEAMDKLPGEVNAYLRWLGEPALEEVMVKIVQDCPSELRIEDADSDVLFESELVPLTMQEYERLKALALRSAQNFLQLYEAISEKDSSKNDVRTTFYGAVPRTAREMYEHTKNVNDYYFAEIGVPADNEGDIFTCRRRGFSALEQQPGFLNNAVFEGSWGENWTLRKVLRRFLWHDRIHAKAMWRMAKRSFPDLTLPDPFYFE